MSVKNGGTVARNYAETLLSLAKSAGDTAEWGATLRHVATAVSADITLQRFLESPRIPAEHKISMLKRALGDRVPRLFMSFIVRLVQLAGRTVRLRLVPRARIELSFQTDAVLMLFGKRRHRLANRFVGALLRSWVHRRLRKLCKFFNV